MTRRLPLLRSALKERAAPNQRRRVPHTKTPQLTLLGSSLSREHRCCSKCRDQAAIRGMCGGVWIKHRRTKVALRLKPACRTVGRERQRLEDIGAKPPDPRSCSRRKLSWTACRIPLRSFVYSEGAGHRHRPGRLQE